MTEDDWNSACDYNQMLSFVFKRGSLRSRLLERKSRLFALDCARDFSLIPILADALEDAGCDSDDILSHCRGDGPHVRGCWVGDQVLGKT